MQLDRDDVFAAGPDLGIQVDSLMGDGDAESGDRIGDHAVRNGAEEVTVIGSLEVQFDCEFLELGGDALSGFEFSLALSFDFFLVRGELSESGRCGNGGKFSREEKVSCIAGSDMDFLAGETEVFDVLEKDQFHGGHSNVFLWVKG